MAPSLPRHVGPADRLALDIPDRPREPLLHLGSQPLVLRKLGYLGALGRSLRFRDDADLELVLRMCTTGGAQLIGALGYGVEVGDRADLVLIEAENGAEAVAMHPTRKWVIKRGRIVARDGCIVDSSARPR